MSIYTAPANLNLEITAQRTDILHFMDVSTVIEPKPTGDEKTYCLMGAGWTAVTESPSAQTKERKYINEKSKRKNITSYAPSFAFEVLLMQNNPAIRWIYDIYTKRLTGVSAVISMITVDMFDTNNAVGDFYPARLGNYAVEVSSCDDDDDMIIKGNFNGQGDEAIGWFDVKNGVFVTTKPEATTENDGQTEESEEPIE